MKLPDSRGSSIYHEQIVVAWQAVMHSVRSIKAPDNVVVVDTAAWQKENQ